MKYSITHGNTTLTYSPDELTCVINSGKNVWEWGLEPVIILNDDTKLLFRDATCHSNVYTTGVADGIKARYTNFSTDTAFVVETFVWMNPSNCEINFEVSVHGDSNLQIKKLMYPAPFKLDCATGYSVLPRMQGTLVPAGTTISLTLEKIQERDGYMCFFGQVRESAGYIAIFTTPYEACYCLPGDDMVWPYFYESMGTIRYTRTMRYRFFDDNCDYVTIAKAYRSYIKEKGQFVSLSEKINRNPNVAKLIGTPIIHTGIATHISPDSEYYNAEEPEKNDRCTPFSVIGGRLRKLKENGLEKAYLHLDGWGVRGYDNQHPDPFPPNEEAGGAAEMKKLSDTCRELGYEFGIHDQYRDYYYDAATFSFDNAIVNADGTHPFCSIWDGGKHSFLCTSLAPLYVRRNYDEFERLGIRIDGAYLDVFSVVMLDECVSDEHPMTREQCAAYRRECFEILNARGIITSSEEAIDSVVPAIALCHHAPYFVEDMASNNSAPAGIHVPLFNLVYHDALIIPWFGLKGEHGGTYIPGSDSCYLHALLNGGTVYCPDEADSDTIKSLETALTLHKQVALEEMVSHTMVNGNIRVQRTTFSDGTTVEVDFDNDTYKINIPGKPELTGTV